MNREIFAQNPRNKLLHNMYKSIESKTTDAYGWRKVMITKVRYNALQNVGLFGVVHNPVLENQVSDMVRMSRMVIIVVPGIFLIRIRMGMLRAHTIYENAKLRAQLFDKTSEQKDTTKGTSVNTQFRKQSILGKPPSSSGSKLYSVTHFPKSKGLLKIDKSHALSKPVTSNSVPTPQESKVVKNYHMIALGMFRINPFNTSREEKSLPNKPIKASVRTKPISISQPHVITKKDVNSDSNGLSSIGIDNTTNTRRP
ncbi:hypothetical protein Tco_0922876 [Tanacetum coccineum]|uniref:Uncharacterized protein n=1 Tax=Tanacetum coccineum TaxID=301880 RepID=A0ABQ5D0Q5_9ASTR